MAVLTASQISLSLISTTGSRNASRQTMILRSYLLSGVCLVKAGVGCGFGFVAWAFLVVGGVVRFVLVVTVLVELLVAATFTQDFGGLLRTVESLASIWLLVWQWHLVAAPSGRFLP